MRTLFLAAAFILATGSAMAQGCTAINGITSCVPVSPTAPGPIVVPVPGNHAPYVPAPPVVQSGPLTVYGNGASSVQSGNTTQFSTGHSCTTIGNITTCN